MAVDVEVEAAEIRRAFVFFAVRFLRAAKRDLASSHLTGAEADEVRTSIADTLARAERLYESL